MEILRTSRIIHSLCHLNSKHFKTYKRECRTRAFRSEAQTCSYRMYKGFTARRAALRHALLKFAYTVKEQCL